MSSMPGIQAHFATSLADRYEIVRELGQGGMAVVYLARDVRHDRAVALKVLRPELAAVLGAERFLAEIRTTAQLQHPNILPLHDSGETNGALFYVMPFVEGESLRERLDREGQLPVAEAVRIATEVAGALDYAHRRGVIHRDIKPANILLHEGRALVADFGIALAAARTGKDRLTETGLSLGTPAYMSPEQALGDRVIDGRTDIYALGCVLYEMLSGEPPFTGPAAQAIIARVATERPRPLIPLRHTIPPAVEGAVMTALEKLPADRFDTGQELIAALEGRTFPRLTPQSPAADALARRRKVWALAGWGVAAAVVSLALLTSKRPAPPHHVARYRIAFPPSQVPGGWGLAFTPDGSRLIYPGPNKDAIYVKQRDQFEAKPIAGTDSADGLAVSPNGEWVAFTQRFFLRKVRITGGDIVTLDSRFIGSTVWLDDTSLVYRTSPNETRRISANGGRPTTIFPRDPLSYRLVTAALPNGFLFVKCSVPRCAPPHELWAFDFRTKREQQLLSDVVRAWYLPPGYVAVARKDARIYAAPFDVDRLEVRGAPVPVLDRVSRAVLGLAPQVAISDSGDLVAQISGSASMDLVRHQLVEVDRTGRATPIDSSWTVYLSTYDAERGIGWALAPDGGRLAIGLYTIATYNGIWIKRLPRGPSSLVSTGESSEFAPRWAANGRSLFYVRRLSGVDGSELWQRPVDGAGRARILVRLPDQTILDVAVTNDGKSVILAVGKNDGQADLLVLQPGVDSVPGPLLANPKLQETSPALSPNGQWLAYVSNETGRPEVYIRRFPDSTDGKWQVSNGGAQSPVWARKGDELFYIDAARNMVAASVPSGSSARTGEPHKLFHLEDSVLVAENRAAFDITLDDRRFIMAREVGPALPTPSTFILVEHWFDEVKEKLRKAR